ncbi:MAG: PepSY-associated TM helix domain-containing protein [Gammaproteobacteria bacterium]
MSLINNSWNWTRTPVAKKVFHFCRWLHVYLSTALFTLLIFFSVSGITLNHPNWFTGDNQQGQLHISLPEDIRQLLYSDSPSIELLKDFIEARSGLVNPRSIDIDIESHEIGFDYPLPAGYAFVSLLADSGTMDVEFKKGNLIALFNDLHKGRHTASAWSWLIDISAFAIALLSFTGLIILLQHKQKRLTGLVLMISGSLTPVLVFLIWVPSLALE